MAYLKTYIAMSMLILVVLTRRPGVVVKINLTRLEQIKDDIIDKINALNRPVFVEDELLGDSIKTGSMTATMGALKTETIKFERKGPDNFNIIITDWEFKFDMVSSAKIVLTTYNGMIHVKGSLKKLVLNISFEDINDNRFVPKVNVTIVEFEMRKSNFTLQADYGAKSAAVSKIMTTVFTGAVKNKFQNKFQEKFLYTANEGLKDVFRNQYPYTIDLPYNLSVCNRMVKKPLITENGVNLYFDGTVFDTSVGYKGCEISSTPQEIAALAQPATMTYEDAILDDFGILISEYTINSVLKAVQGKQLHSSDGISMVLKLEENESVVSILQSGIRVENLTTFLQTSFGGFPVTLIVKLTGFAIPSFVHEPCLTLVVKRGAYEFTEFEAIGGYGISKASSALKKIAELYLWKNDSFATDISKIKLPMGLILRDVYFSTHDGYIYAIPKLNLDHILDNFESIVGGILDRYLPTQDQVETHDNRII